MTVVVVLLVSDKGLGWSHCGCIACWSLVVAVAVIKAPIVGFSVAGPLVAVWLQSLVSYIVVVSCSIDSRGSIVVVGSLPLSLFGSGRPVAVKVGCGCDQSTGRRLRWLCPSRCGL